MEYRTLGRTGLKVSALGFGAAPLGIQDYLGAEDKSGGDCQERGQDAIREALKLGVTFFDTAEGYGNGLSERLIGAALEGNRDQALLATKFGFDPGRKPGEYTDKLKASLERLRTGHVDLLQMHGDRFDDGLAERTLASCVFDWLEEMRGLGLIRFTGLTAEMPTGALERLIVTGRFDVLQIQYSLIHQTSCDYARGPAGIIPLARSLGMGIISNRSATSGFFHRLCRTAAVGADPDELTQLSIRYALSTPEVNCVLIGMLTPEEVRENVKLATDLGLRLDLSILHDRFVHR